MILIKMYFFNFLHIQVNEDLQKVILNNLFTIIYHLFS